MSENLAGALAAFYGKVGTIHKDAKAQYGNFADLAGVLSVVNPALAECGLAVAQSFDDDETGRYLRTTLLHTGGEKIESRAKLVTEGGRGNPLHTWGGATTYQRRFCLLAMLNLAAGIEDDDGDSAEPEPKKTVKPAPIPTQALKSTAKAELEELGDQAPADQTDVKEILAVLAAWMESDKDTDQKLFQQFCKSFRSHKGLLSNAKIRENLLTIADTKWAQEFINSPPAA